MNNRTKTQLNNFIEQIAKAWNLSLEEAESLKERLKQIKEREICNNNS